MFVALCFSNVDTYYYHICLLRNLEIYNEFVYQVGYKECCFTIFYDCNRKHWPFTWSYMNVLCLSVLLLQNNYRTPSLISLHQIKQTKNYAWKQIEKYSVCLSTGLHCPILFSIFIYSIEVCNVLQSSPSGQL